MMKTDAFTAVACLNRAHKHLIWFAILMIEPPGEPTTINNFPFSLR
jgi:hypothetical protein